MNLPSMLGTSRKREDFSYEDDDGVEHEVMAEYTVYEASRGRRVAGLQMEPDEPRSFEINETYIMVGDKWQIWDCSTDQLNWFENKIEESGF